jgi:tRNA 2-selenouridine synthase
LKKTDLPTSNAYRELLLQQTPMIDVRAPAEFAKGALPSAVNLPFINDEERHLIGICYKEKGQQAAIDLGNELVKGDKKAQRVEAWKQFIEKHPNAVVYCARGGLRSQISQQWLADSGINCTQIEGGYKSLRTFLLQYLGDSCRTERFTLLSGMTGTGKTDIIKTLNTSIDLEGHANHKGSSFGRPLNEQPSQIDFENNLTLALLKVRENYPKQRIILEDESRNIGGRHLPDALNVVMAASEMVVIELPVEERIEKLWQEYVVQRYEETIEYHQKHYQSTGQGDEKEREKAELREVGEQAFSDYLIDSLLRLKKRLGSQRTSEIAAMISSAVQRQHTDNFGSHRDWLRAITVGYYDPMYLYQLDKRKDRVVFRGDQQSVIQWLQEKA